MLAQRVLVQEDVSCNEVATMTHLGCQVFSSNAARASAFGSHSRELFANVRPELRCGIRTPIGTLKLLIHLAVEGVTLNMGWENNQHADDGRDRF
jgi:hypothetical protein